MNAVEAMLLPYGNAESVVVDDPEKRLMTKIALAERQYAEGKCTPAADVAAELFAIAARA